MQKDYSAQIKQLRVALGMTQHSLADQLGVRPQVVASWEQGRREPSATSYQHLALLAPPERAWFFLSKIGITRKFIESKWQGNKPVVPPGRQKPDTAARRKRSRPSAIAAGDPVLRDQVAIPIILRRAVPPESPDSYRDDQIDQYLTVPLGMARKGSGSYTGYYVSDSGRARKEDPLRIIVVDHTRRDPVRLREKSVAYRFQDRVWVGKVARESRQDHIVLVPETGPVESVVLRNSEANPILGEAVFWLGSQNS